MIFSVQNSIFLFSVFFSLDIVQTQVRKTVCGFFLARIDIPIQVWYMVEGMRRDLNEHDSFNASTHDREPFGEIQMMKEIAEHVRMNYPDTSDSRYVAQPVDDFLFPWEEGSLENPIIIEEDEGFSEPRTPVSEPPRQPPAMEARPTLGSIENLENFQNQLLDSSLNCK